MKQIGQPIVTIEQGVKFTLGFGSVTACLTYLAYHYPCTNPLASLGSMYGVLLTGQVAYNTLALGFSSESEDSLFAPDE